MKAQSGYYSLPSASAVLENRINALSGAIPPGSVLLDLGCNDGSIGRALINNGSASRVVGYDLENILSHDHSQFEFKQANLLTYDLCELPPADGVLILNVLHHIIGSSKERAKFIIDYLLDKYKFVFVDLGSFTEVGDWIWRKAYDQLFSSDAELWSFLFSNASLKFKLLRYPTQGGGHRVLWKLYKHTYPIRSLTAIRSFKRRIGSWPTDKVLLDAVEADGPNIAQHIQFDIARSPENDLFWIKRYALSDGSEYATLEHELGTLASDAFAKMCKLRLKEARDFRVAQALQVDDKCAILAFEPDLLEASPAHFQDWPLFLNEEAQRSALVLASMQVKYRSLPTVMLHNLCDFQVAAGWDGHIAMDFEPNPWVIWAAKKLGGTKPESDWLRAPEDHG